MEIPGGGGSSVKPTEMENPRGWGVKLEKTLCGGGGMDIFWNHTIPTPGYKGLCDSKRMYLSSKPWLPTLTMPARRVN